MPLCSKGVQKGGEEFGEPPNGLIEEVYLLTSLCPSFSTTKVNNQIRQALLAGSGTSQIRQCGVQVQNPFPSKRAHAWIPI